MKFCITTPIPFHGFPNTRPVMRIKQKKFEKMSTAVASTSQNFQRGNKGDTKANEKERGKDVRYSNIEAAKGKDFLEYLV